jgi:hypothetical protein
MGSNECHDTACTPGADVENLRFNGILFPGPNTTPSDPRGPTFFRDLNLDQVVRAAAPYVPDHEIAAFFYTPLQDVDAVVYRQEVMLDLESEATKRAILAFS